MIGLLLALVPPRGFTLVRAGRPRTVIVLPAGSPPSMRYAASELRTTLATMSGATVPIVGAARGPAIRLVADPKLGPEEFALACGPGGVTVRGGAPRGVLYGCDSLLEDHLGCRWYTRATTVIPKRATVVLPPFRSREKPAFEYREISFWEATDGVWAAHNRLNGSGIDLTAAQGGKVSYGGGFVHTLGELLPASTYFASHPEYFAMRDGKRVPDQPELTNPDVLKIVVAAVEQEIEANPSATLFSVSQNDNWANSQSPETLAIDRLEGAPSGLLLRFVNAVARAVAKRHPNVLIDTLAYQWSEKPPGITRPLPNVRVRIAPIGADFAHPLDGSAANRTAYANLRAWHAIAPKLYVWHYATDYANYLQPLPDLDEMAGDVPLFAREGVVGLYFEGDYAQGGGGDMAELKSYLFSKLAWNPARPAWPIVEEFCRGVYGPAADDVLSWLRLLQAAVRDRVATIYDPPTAPYFSDELLKRGDALFDAAERATAGRPEAAAVAKARLGLDYLEAMRPGVDPARRAAAARRVASGIARFGIAQYREGAPVAELLKALGAE